MGVRPAISAEDVYMERVASYGFFAERYHWTPEQVDRLPLWYARRLPAFAAIVEEINEEHIEAAKKK